MTRTWTCWPATSPFHDQAGPGGSTCCFSCGFACGPTGGRAGRDPSVACLILESTACRSPCATMTKTSTALTFRHITAKALERAKLTTAYALLERDLFRAHGRTAVRHLTDDERRQLARMGHDIGCPWENGYAGRLIHSRKVKPAAQVPLHQ